MIVNGLTDPRVACPGGDPELLMLDETAYPCEGNGCIVMPNWPDLEGWHALTCVNDAGASEALAVEVPELGTVPGLLVGLVCALVAGWVVKPRGVV